MKLIYQIALIIGLSLAAFFLHGLVLAVSGLQDQGATAHYSLLSPYIGYSAAAILIVIVLSRVRLVNLDYVGYTFVALTGLKMLVSFGVFYSAIHDALRPLTALEKKNILVVFIFFLAIETLIAIRILNSRQ